MTATDRRRLKDRRAHRDPAVWLLAAVIGALVVSFGLLLYVAGTL